MVEEVALPPNGGASTQFHKCKSIVPYCVESIDKVNSPMKLNS